MEKSSTRLIVLVIILLSLMAPAAGAPASLDKTKSELAIAGPSMTADVLAVIYPCHFEGMVTDEETGDPIRGVAVTFVKDDDRRTWTRTTSTSGSYRVELPEGSYSYIATHKNYVMVSSSPELVSVRAPYSRRVGGAGGIVREITVTGESTKEVDIEMEPRPRDVLLVTTSLLTERAALEDAVESYIETVARTDGLVARYIVLDSSDCFAEYGVRMDDPTDWHEIRDALEAISESFGTEFMRAGAAAFVARNTEQGTPNHFGAHFSDCISGTGSQGTYRIGDALFELMRESVLRAGDSEKTAAAQLCIYGDPTIKRNPLEILVYSRPALTSMR